MDLIKGDITTLDLDCIVNAANEDLMPGGGVCGAIHEAAGKDLAVECKRIGHCGVGIHLKNAAETLEKIQNYRSMLYQ